MEEITHELDGSTQFTNLEGTSSYLCIVLDCESSLLTTFNSPWGQYCFIYLSWVFNCLQDIFQCMMDQLLHCCDGMIRIIYDVIIHGNDDEEHDRHLHKVMEEADEHGFLFSSGKCAVKQSSLTFFGCV